MIIRKGDSETEAGLMPSEELLSAMGRYNEEMVKAGVMIEGSGLQPTAKGARVKFSGGKPTVTDGPFAESKELIAGYSIIQVKSKEEAVEWVKRWPVEDAHGNANIEIRQLYELEDFGPSEAVERMREVGLAPRV
jgi:hypothetical protein